MHMNKFDKEELRQRPVHYEQQAQLSDPLVCHSGALASTCYLHCSALACVILAMSFSSLNRMSLLSNCKLLGLKAIHIVLETTLSS
jgi:hypothetical protein